MAPNDPRRPDRVYRYQKDAQSVGGSTAEYFNAVGMICSLVGLLMKVTLLTLVFLHEAVFTCYLCSIYTHTVDEVGFLDRRVLLCDVLG